MEENFNNSVPLNQNNTSTPSAPAFPESISNTIPNPIYQNNNIYTLVTPLEGSISNTTLSPTYQNNLYPQSIPMVQYPQSTLMIPNNLNTVSTIQPMTINQNYNSNIPIIPTKHNVSPQFNVPVNQTPTSENNQSNEKKRISSKKEKIPSKTCCRNLTATIILYGAFLGFLYYFLFYLGINLVNNSDEFLEKLNGDYVEDGWCSFKRFDSWNQISCQYKPSKRVFDLDKKRYMMSEAEYSCFCPVTIHFKSMEGSRLNYEHKIKYDIVKFDNSSAVNMENITADVSKNTFNVDISAICSQNTDECVRFDIYKCIARNENACCSAELKGSPYTKFEQYCQKSDSCFLQRNSLFKCSIVDGEVNGEHIQTLKEWHNLSTKRTNTLYILFAIFSFVSLIAVFYFTRKMVKLDSRFRCFLIPCCGCCCCADKYH